MTTRGNSVGVDGELLRLRHAVDRMKASISSLELTLRYTAEEGSPPGAEVGQALVSTVFEIATGLAKVDALIRSKDNC